MKPHLCFDQLVVGIVVVVGLYYLRMYSAHQAQVVGACVEYYLLGMTEVRAPEWKTAVGGWALKDFLGIPTGVVMLRPCLGCHYKVVMIERGSDFEWRALKLVEAGNKLLAFSVRFVSLHLRVYLEVMFPQPRRLKRV